MFYWVNILWLNGKLRYFKSIQLHQLQSLLLNGKSVFRGISWNDRAPASHAGSTGIDTRILQGQVLCNNSNIYVFSFFFVVLFSSFTCTWLPAQNYCIKVAYSTGGLAGSSAIRSCIALELANTPVLQASIIVTVLSTDTRTKVLVVHPISPAAEDGEDDDLGVFDVSGDMKSRKKSSEPPSIHSFSKLDDNI